MALAPDYTLELGDAWLPIPLEFPWGAFTDARAWGTELAESLLHGVATGDEARDLLRDTAITLQSMPSPLPGAQERFWRTEDVGGESIVAHLYITDTDAAGVDDMLQLVRAGLGGAVQTWRLIDGTAFDAAVAAVVVAEIDEGRDIAATRYLGVRAGHVFLLDLIEENPYVLEAVDAEIEQIFRSIRFS